MFVSTRVITTDVARLAGFYERATGIPATWRSPEFAEFVTSGATLALGSTRTVPPEAAEAGANRSVIIEFRIDDVDAMHHRLADSGADVVMAPTTMPWGNRSLLVRDPDGNLVNFFTPVSAAALARHTP